MSTISSMTSGMAKNLMKPQVLGMLAMAAKPRIEEFLASLNKPPEQNEADRLIKEALARQHMESAREKFGMPRIPEETVNDVENGEEGGNEYGPGSLEEMLAEKLLAKE